LQIELFNKIKQHNSLILLDPRFREDDERGAQGLRRSTKMMKGGCEDDESGTRITKEREGDRMTNGAQGLRRSKGGARMVKDARG